MAKLNIALSAEENILALVAQANPTLNLSASQVTIGVPTVAAGTDGRNTEVTLTAVANAGFSGTQTFAYTRRELAAGQAIATSKAIPVAINPEDSQATILTKAALALGLLESELTVANYVEPENEDTPGSIDIVANAGSLLYTGTYIAVLSIPDTDVPLSEAASVTDLNGFDAED